jgi:hypothetical protein
MAGSRLSSRTALRALSKILLEPLALSQVGSLCSPAGYPGADWDDFAFVLRVLRHITLWSLYTPFHKPFFQRSADRVDDELKLAKPAALLLIAICAKNGILCSRQNYHTPSSAAIHRRLSEKHRIPNEQL